MIMTKPKAMTLAAFSLWPIVYMILFFTVFLTLFADRSVNEQADRPILIFFAILTLHLFTMLEIPALIAIYLFHLVQTDTILKDKKVLWAVLLSLGNILAMPVYWYRYIWKPLTSSRNA